MTKLPGGVDEFVWSPDGKQLAFLRGGRVKYRGYDSAQIAVISADGGEACFLAAELDRSASDLVCSADGRSLLFLLEDDRSRQLASIRIKDRKAARLSEAKATAQGFSLKGKRIALLLSRPMQPGEIYALEQGRMRPLSKQNDKLVERLQTPAACGAWLAWDGSRVADSALRIPPTSMARCSHDRQNHMRWFRSTASCQANSGDILATPSDWSAQGFSALVLRYVSGQADASIVSR